MSVEMMAMLVGSMIQGQVVAVYNTERQGACKQVNQSTELAQNIPTTPHTDTLQPTVTLPTYLKDSMLSVRIALPTNTGSLRDITLHSNYLYFT